ncbi:DUF2231 domain-containing protein [Falsigemmobacter faecalis]|uniref:DUF2231 domain-containing protein n=1 Tax=Falsigemmobacter faecalis TaxID=2488730 RepID=A0A3P3DH43_9RHOB|nr:DUF2231 domain-containing protein [Falsigemmobacter faecalis]RRH72996.1 hypothetical protein EG244_13650 [Falsigemmobacter faecalis]
MYSAQIPPRRARSVHPFHALLLAFFFPLFSGTFLADLAYAQTYEIQWSNFAEWLNAAGLVFGGVALLAAVVSYISRRSTGGARRVLWYGAALLAAWITGLFNAFIHARDAWGIMPDALWWSGISALLALIASWIAWRGFPDRGDD